MSWVIQCLGWANPAYGPCPHADHYVTRGDHDARDGLGYFEFHPDIERAMQFPSVGEAMDFWRKQSTVRPLRPDGKPNRPLTAMHAEIKQKGRVFRGPAPFVV